MLPADLIIVMTDTPTKAFLDAAQQVVADETLARPFLLEILSRFASSP